MIDRVPFHHEGMARVRRQHRGFNPQGVHDSGKVADKVGKPVPPEGATGIPVASLREGDRSYPRRLVRQDELERPQGVRQTVQKEQRSPRPITHLHVGDSHATREVEEANRRLHPSLPEPVAALHQRLDGIGQVLFGNVVVSLLDSEAVSLHEDVRVTEALWSLELVAGKLDL